MLSILIPTYNYDVTQLVRSLHEQGINLLVDFEVIVIEDGSTECVETNRQIENLSFCQHIVLQKNIGRSAIRNKLADSAKYPYLLFIDCDAEVKNKDFLHRYISVCTEDAVVIGGTAYDISNQDRDCSLRLKYGRKRESNIKYLLSHKGNENFATFNFLISKSVFNQVRFDESLVKYGHEDTLFGYMLHERGYKFKRIDNPLIHRGVDSNKVFLKKTVESVKNLYFIYTSGKYPYLINESKLLQTYKTLEKWHFVPLVRLKFRVLKKIMEKNLSSKNPSLIIYDLYKLMTLCTMRQ
ncbi:glycosyltransferase [Paludibacter sp.]